MNVESRRGSRQAHPRPQMYPRWGMEVPNRVSNAHRLYRYGEWGILTRLIVPADERRRYFAAGLSIGEVAIIVLALAFVRLIAEAVGIGIDGYLQAMGW